MPATYSLRLPGRWRTRERRPAPRPAHSATPPWRPPRQRIGTGADHHRRRAPPAHHRPTPPAQWQSWPRPCRPVLDLTRVFGPEGPLGWRPVSGRCREVDAAGDDAEGGTPAAGLGGLAVEQRVLMADQEALRGGDEMVAVPPQQPADAPAGVAGERRDAVEPGVEGGRQGMPAAAEALEPVLLEPVL